MHRVTVPFKQYQACLKHSSTPVCVNTLMSVIPIGSAPIGNLPNDVLQEIFMECLSDTYWAITLSPSEVPVLLTHVCQRWRQVASAFPRLWGSLRWWAKWERANNANVDIFVAMAMRAKSSPRATQVVLHTTYFRPTTAQSPGFKSLPNIPNRLFVPSVPSLTRLILRGVHILHLHELPSGSFPSLTLLGLYLEGSDLETFPWQAKGPVRTFSDAPALRRVAFGASLPSSCPRKTYVSPNLLLPWAQLTHILDFAAPADGQYSIHDYLQECRNLHVLFADLHDRDVDGWGLDNWKCRSADPIALENLESLTIHYWGCADTRIGYPAFIDAFKFPTLKALRLEGSELDFSNSFFWTESLANNLISKISSFGHLTYLSICSVIIDLLSMRRVLAAAPNITTLDAQIFENYKFFFEAISWDPDDELLPKLETLVLDVDDSDARCDGEGETISPQGFDAFLGSRLRSGTPFCKVIVYASLRSYVDDDVPFVAVAHEYSSQGLELERRIVTVERDRKAGFEWMERDPELRDWPELAELLFM